MIVFIILEVNYFIIVIKSVLFLRNGVLFNFNYLGKFRFFLKEVLKFGILFFEIKSNVYSYYDLRDRKYKFFISRAEYGVLILIFCFSLEKNF